ncbi:UNVERIFIED_CONTAM: hypothetical protein Slati_3849000 [Sesamum latifolium]|uniref:Retrotransposon Copia-like N-terminal domain-containing protein n=1 Tax=Sesamum latifolium TaxID=2727402 RepID=A0AAW2TKR1_9LAMI
MTTDPEIFKLQPSDNLGVSLVYVLLDGSNYLTWSRSVKIALGAKMKLGFINGKLTKPVVDNKAYEQWVGADYMVTSWILNSMSNEITEAFLYTNNASMAENRSSFGQSNGPMLYKLKREISYISQ